MCPQSGCWRLLVNVVVYDATLIVAGPEYAPQDQPCDQRKNGEDCQNTRGANRDRQRDNQGHQGRPKSDAKKHIAGDQGFKDCQTKCGGQPDPPCCPKLCHDLPFSMLKAFPNASSAFAGTRTVCEVGPLPRALSASTCLSAT